MCTDVSRQQRLAEDEALSLVAARGSDGLKLVLGIHTLCDNREAEFMCQVCH